MSNKSADQTVSEKYFANIEDDLSELLSIWQYCWHKYENNCDVIKEFNSSFIVYKLKYCSSS